MLIKSLGAETPRSCWALCYRNGLRHESPPPHTACALRVIFHRMGPSLSSPLWPPLRTYRCVALTDVEGPITPYLPWERTWWSVATCK